LALTLYSGVGYSQMTCNLCKKTYRDQAFH
jgi:hypothetical protein